MQNKYYSTNRGLWVWFSAAWLVVLVFCEIPIFRDQGNPSLWRLMRHFADGHYGSVMARELILTLAIWLGFYVAIAAFLGWFQQAIVVVCTTKGIADKRAYQSTGDDHELWRVANKSYRTLWPIWVGISLSLFVALGFWNVDIGAGIETSFWSLVMGFLSDPNQTSRETLPVRPFTLLVWAGVCVAIAALAGWAIQATVIVCTRNGVD